LIEREIVVRAGKALPIRNVTPITSAMKNKYVEHPFHCAESKNGLSFASAKNLPNAPALDRLPSAATRPGRSGAGNQFLGLSS
jgi:hypothetical protein